MITQDFSSRRLTTYTCRKLGTTARTPPMSCICVTLPRSRPSFPISVSRRFKRCVTSIRYGALRTVFLHSFTEVEQQHTCPVDLALCERHCLGRGWAMYGHGQGCNGRRGKPSGGRTLKPE